MRKNTTFLLLLAFCFSFMSTVPVLAIQKYYKAEFRGWRDENTSLGFHATIVGKKNEALVTVPIEYEFGKVMTKEQGMTMDITPNLSLQITVDAITDESSLEVEIMESQPPYSGHKILKNIKDPGTYTIKLSEKTGWEGMRSFWVAIWLHGAGAEAKVSKLQVGEGIKMINEPLAGLKKKRPRNTKKIFGKGLKETKDDFRPDKEKNYAYYEDWSQGLNGWRDDSIEKGLNTIADITGKRKMVLSVKPKVAYGVFMSPPKPLKVDFNIYPFLELEMGQALTDGKVRIRLINSRNPDDFRIIIPNFERSDVYMMNVPDLTGWREEKSFYLEIMLEGEDAELAVNSIGFSKKMATMQGILVQNQTVPAIQIAPLKTLEALNLSVFSDQSYRAQWMDGVAKDADNFRELNRYGIPHRDIGFNEIKQIFYLNMYFRPTDNIESWLGLGYDITNATNNVAWEEPGGRYMDARIDFGTLRYYDLYLGNVAQLGTVYDPLFTDLTFKKDKDFRGILWKPKLGQWQFKFFGTRLSTNSGSGNRENIFMTAVRAVRGFVFTGLGSLQFGVSAMNMTKSNGIMDDNIFTGPDESAAVYKRYVQSLYVKIENNTLVQNRTGEYHYSNLYIKPSYDIEVTIGNSNDADIVAPLNTDASGNLPYFDSGYNTYLDDNAGNFEIREGGNAVVRIPLIINQGINTGERIDPSEVEEIILDLQLGIWNVPEQGTVNVKISSDGETWQTIRTYDLADLAGPGTDPIIDESIVLSAAQLAQYKQGTFEDEETMAKSIVGLDVKGQILGVNIKGEMATSVAHNQTYTGERVNRIEPAGYINLSRGFEGAIINASYFNISAEYSTSFSGFDMVEDNDNSGTLRDSHGDKAGVIFGDVYNIGQPSAEYTHDLYIPKDYLFHEKSDKNHNGILDSRENDHEPDYPYRRDQRGVEVSLIVPRQVLSGLYMSNVEIGIYGHRIERLSRPGHNESLAASLNYRNTDYADMDFSVGVYGARIRDDISDQYALYNAKDEDEILDRIVITNEYEDNITITPELKVKYTPSWGLKATLVDRFRYNKELFNEKNEYYGNFCSVDLRYKQYVVDSLACQPVYVGRFGARQANASSPIHNTYYLPQQIERDAWGDVPVFHGFYLKNSFIVINEYQLAIDVGREISYMSKHGKAEKIKDLLVLGVTRDLPRGKIRFRYELNKIYYPYMVANNWGQSAIWAKLELAF
ncbi:hypothetical protein KAR34_06955 [bacterium]|nr:hypothetical protein [bacterium]